MLIQHTTQRCTDGNRSLSEVHQRGVYNPVLQLDSKTKRQNLSTVGLNVISLVLHVMNAWFKIIWDKFVIFMDVFLRGGDTHFQSL